MAALTVTRSYADGEILLENDLDAFLDDIETFLNSTRINDDNIQDGGITGSSKIVNASITGAKLANLTVSTAKIADDSITKEKVAADVAGLGLGQNANGSLEVNVDDSTIEIDSDTLRVKDLAITTAKLADDSVTSAKIATGAVGTLEILDSNVTTAKLANNAVTRAKMAAVGHAFSSSSGGPLNTSSTTYATITNQSVTITTTGRPVVLMCLPASASTGGQFSVIGANAALVGQLRWRRATTAIAEYNVNGNVGYFPASAINFVDAPAAGTYTYTLQWAVSNGAVTIATEAIKIIAYEL